MRGLGDEDRLRPEDRRDLELGRDGHEHLLEVAERLDDDLLVLGRAGAASGEEAAE